MSVAILPEPPRELKQLSRKLCDTLLQRIHRHGSLSFAEFMETALYEPGLGYYSAGLQKFGAEGDFITAPELGSLFGSALARQVDEVAERLSESEFDLLEVGAGTGQLAAALSSHLTIKPRRYYILERSADLRERQRKTLRATAATGSTGISFEWLDQPPAEAWTGIVIANEVLDALPVERFRLHRGTVTQQKLAAATRVGSNAAAAFADLVRWRFEPADNVLEAAVEGIISTLGEDWDDGFTSEVNLNIAGFLHAISDSLHAGAVLLIDYGYPRREYYLPQRSDGTLICHYRHRAHDDDLFYPGLQDITAFVDFTAVAEAAEHCGLDLAGYTSQAMFLLGCGIGDLLEQNHLLAGEAHRLLMPGDMGEKFQVMALSRGLPGDPVLRGFSMRDLSHRL